MTKTIIVIHRDQDVRRTLKRTIDQVTRSQDVHFFETPAEVMTYVMQEMRLGEEVLLITGSTFDVPGIATQLIDAVRGWLADKTKEYVKAVIYSRNPQAELMAVVAGERWILMPDDGELSTLVREFLGA